MKRSSSVRLGMPFAACVYLCVMYLSGEAPTHENRIAAFVGGVLKSAPLEVSSVALSVDGVDSSFERMGKQWRDVGAGSRLSDENTAVLEQAIKYLYVSAPVRTLPPEEIANVADSAFGLAPPSMTVKLFVQDTVALYASFGARATDGILQYMRLEGDGTLYLMSGFVGDTWRSLRSR